ncbi:MAG: hypothetical protein LPD71_05455 [Shewanella sp.]|nr:hypothetical protein [Shewanella sp.]MCF1431961.1 hypothetical protein [Shewanella sp.]MCF1438198.1 hypothetical protein [Shewanella sp.]MCF1459569.1 hypothetical protein [Shewanella sp.]
MIKKHFLIILCLLTSVVISSSRAYAQPWQWCNGLEVNVYGQILDNYTAVGPPVMTHGSYDGCHMQGGVCDKYTFNQGAVWGPDATLTFKNKTTGKLVKVEIQQNFCFLEAGDITVTPLQGKWVYQTHTGSYHNYDGTVHLRSVTDE